MAHAFFAPSSAPRVVECPASVLLTYGMPDRQSQDAAHGTAAHWIADLCLRGKHMVERYAGCRVLVNAKGACEFWHEGNHEDAVLGLAFGELLSFEVDDEMVNAVQEYIDWCNAAPGDHYPECRVDISKWCPQIEEDESIMFAPAAAFEPQFGTSDHAACSPGKLIITDLKYGKGVQVYAERNYQAILYALGFIEEWNWLYDFDVIEIRICQPRLDHKDVWVTTKDELLEIGEYIRARFTLALQSDPPFGPSEKACKFCKASGLCRAQSEYLSKIRALAFEDLDDPFRTSDKPEFQVRDPRLLTDEELVEAWRAHPLYKARFEAIDRHITEMLLAHKPVDGFKLVAGRTFRKWHDEALARDELLFKGVDPEKLYSKPALVSPAQAEKLLPKAERGIISTLAYKPRGEPCVAEAHDKRPAYEDVVKEQVDAVFDDLDDPFA